MCRGVSSYKFGRGMRERISERWTVSPLRVVIHVCRRHELRLLLRPCADYCGVIFTRVFVFSHEKSVETQALSEN